MRLRRIAEARTPVAAGVRAIRGYALESAGNALATVPATQVVPVPTGVCSTCAHECDWDMGWMANMECPEGGFDGDA